MQNTTNYKSKRMVYHKESCITCKKSISEIQRMGIDIEKRDFFKEPFSEEELRKIINMTGMKPIELVRRRDKMYKELKFQTKKYSDDQIIKLMIRHPGLITRPIIISKNKALVGKTTAEDLKNC
jgi:arsenate reductase